MKKALLNVTGAKELSKDKQKSIDGSAGPSRPCGGDGSFIYVDGVKVCCYLPWSGQYIC
ncbi:hypothetical protein IWQ47_001253 [Aquimarina sp. EL_43]|uniref:hypothetical protein n=1 Tax=unclassified Aquimarina TaxID=2627091 RepID=UPI0018C99ACC|nr:MULTISPECIES: hypothetical protein [unclassified Aquimarina]MBG6129444.1 hypothetical protein [Aquimarina sp. EL_35]MBG6150509.1 hypothetical protein [Aquimarina sp. EL_32]MBG6168183.1 hypothetical protein [Aquimarina sp. EL_43]